MKKFVFIFFLLVISLFIVQPFLKKSYFPTHDGEWAVVRLAEIHRELKDFQIPPRWSAYLNHGYGYPLFLFTYPFPYFLGEIFYLLGFGLVNSIKIVFILSVFFSGFAMFLLGSKLWGRLGGLISAVFYLYLPYRLVDLYVRGSIGESFAFVFYPFLFWLGVNLVEQRTVTWMVLTAFSLASLILTHNIMALVFIPFWFGFLIIFFLKKIKEEQHGQLLDFLPILNSFLLGLGLSAFFWLPALIEKKYVLVGQIPIANIWENFITPFQLIFPSWGYGLPGQPEAFSFQIGWVHLLGFILGLFLIRKQKIITLFLFLSSLVLVFLMLPQSYFLWHNLFFLKNVDFPWRLLGLLGFFVSFGVGSITLSRRGKLMVVILTPLVILVNIDYAKPISTFDKGDSYYQSNDATTTSFDELMPIWVKKKPMNRPENLVFTKDGKIEVHLKENLSNKIAFTFISQKETNIYLNKIYFPGWKVRIDGKEAYINFDNDYGLISFLVSGGRHKIEAIFERTFIRKVADNLSLFSLIIIFTLLILNFSKTLFWKKIVGKKTLLLLLIVLLGIVLRTFGIFERFVFDYDQEIALFAIHNILNKKIVLIGQEISVGGIFIGPFYYYFLTPFYFLTKFNLYSLIIPNLLVSLGSILTVFLLGRDFINKTVGLLTAFLFAISFPIIVYDQTTNPSNPLMLLAILFFFFLYKFFKNNDELSFLAIFFLLGLSFHLHPSAFPLFIILGLTFLSKKNLKISRKTWFLSLVIFIFMILPLIIFDLRHNFLNLRGVLAFLKKDRETISPLLRFFWLLKVNFENFNNFFFYSFPIFKILSGLILIWFFWQLLRLRYQNNSLFKMILSWFFIPIFSFSFYKGHIPEYYLLITFPLLIFIFAFLINYLLKGNKIYKFLGIFLLILTSFLNLSKNFGFRNPFSLKYKEAVVDFILTDSNGNPGIISFTTEQGLNSGYRFLFQKKGKPLESLKGPNVYTIVVPWSFLDGPQEYYFGGIKVIKR